MSLVLFFFSSRRRHTRLQGDWSSDVCSSDLTGRPIPTSGITQPPVLGFVLRRLFERARDRELAGEKARLLAPRAERWHQIGRASCREREEIAMVGGALNDYSRETWGEVTRRW